MTRFPLVLVLLGILTLVPAASSAQETPVLPNLAPRDVEIRGELTIAFPSLRRQPLVGFNPPPAVPEIPASRRPFAEPYKQSRADIPGSQLGQPVAPSVQTGFRSDPFSGVAEAGFGRYGTRHASLSAAMAAGRGSRLTLSADYEGRSGFAPYAVDAAADGGALEARWRRRSKALVVGVDASGSAHRFALYGLGDVRDRRTRSDAAAGLRLASGTDAAVDFSVQADVFAGQDQVTGQRAGDRTDSGVATRARLETPGALRVVVDGSWLAAGVDAADGSYGGYSGGAGLRLTPGRSRLLVGARILSMHAGAGTNPSSRDREALYLSPHFEFSLDLARNVRLAVVQRPRVESLRTGDVFRGSPFVNEPLWVEPVLTTVDAEASVQAYLGPISLTGRAGLVQSPNWRVFERGRAVPGIPQVRHTAARTWTAGADLQTYLGPGILWRAFGEARAGRLTDLDADMPYLAPWTAGTLVSAELFRGRGLFQMTAKLDGRRFADLAGTDRIPAYANVDLRGTWRVTRQASVVASLRNALGDTAFWYGYPEPEVVFTAGASWRW